VSEPELTAWIGRTEEHVGCLTPILAQMLCAAVSQPAMPAPDLHSGSPMPFLWHWAAFPQFAPLSELGADGHPKLGGFLPPVPLERRMWAGGGLNFSGRFHIGEKLHKRSEIISVDEKHGSTGTMVFVRVAHTIESDGGGRVEEQQDIVYLAIPPSFRAPKPVPEIDTPDFSETIPIDEVRLFRYSAATYNGHRIHYDWPYTRDTEKYPGLVVHGPMQATFLMEAATRHKAQPPQRFRFRGVHPMFHREDLRVLGKAIEGEDAMDLCTAAPAGHQGMQARIFWSHA
jgi:3-methylfumaryl-CoA hydratase